VEYPALSKPVELGHRVTARIHGLKAVVLRLFSI